MIDPNTQIAVTLNAQQWNTVLGQLAEGSYRIVAPLLIAIQQQCQRHDAEAQQNRGLGQLVPFESAS